MKEIVIEAWGDFACFTMPYAKVERLTEILNAQENAEVRDEAAISKTRQQLDNAKAALNNYKSGLEDVNKKLES